MAIRRQFYEYAKPLGAGTSLAAASVVELFANLTKATTTKATEFVVINNFGASPSSYLPDDYSLTIDSTTGYIGDSGAFIQVVIATTGYFVRPDGIQSNGVHSWAVPYPPSDEYQGDIYDLTPDIYVLPGQNWNVNLLMDETVADDDGFRAYVQYTLYDNADSQFAVELFRNSISVTPENVEWYKRELVQAGA